MKARVTAAVAAVMVVSLICLFSFAQEVAPPRRHLYPVPTPTPTPVPCQSASPGTGPWLAAWEIEETASVHMILDVACGSAPCQMLMYLKSGGYDPTHPFSYEVPALGVMHIDGVFSPWMRAYLSPGVSALAARVEVHGADAWAAQRVMCGVPAPWPANECTSPAW